MSQTLLQSPARSSTPRGSRISSPWKFILLLVAVFGASFALPILVTTQIKGWYGSERTAKGSEGPFPQSVLISGPGTSLKISPGADLNPIPNEDFLFVVWFQMLRMPMPGERVTLVAKLDAADESQGGYAIALARDGDSIRPNVFWGGNSFPGRWYSFADIKISPRRWNMLALSFHQGKYLGLHAGEWRGEKATTLSLLGGHELSTLVMPAGEKALHVGAWNQGKFRGRIGGVGVFSRPKIGDALVDILKDALVHPIGLNDLFRAGEIKLWAIDGRRDLSPAAHKVVRLNSGQTDRE